MEIKILRRAPLLLLPIIVLSHSASVSSQSLTSLSSATLISQSVPVAASKSAVKMRAGNQTILMRKSQARKRNSKRLYVFQRKNVRSILDGPQARLKVNSSPITFEAAIPADVFPEDYMVLVRMEVKKDRRQVQIDSRQIHSFDSNEAQLTAASSGFKKKFLVPLEFKALTSVDSQGKVVYRATIPNALESGEYAVYIEDGFYDFSYGNS